ncbi:hypothetical protein [Paraflavitalea speifideaquila]|uniref:hypothetical protein n=1 Tax=Paraflavitalea speifideaquila TaxID=3076558 RepID=UPI0028ECC588|nr:hypothetical protein [Paraflavitalea speifideiaquila]
MQFQHNNKLLRLGSACRCLAVVLCLLAAQNSEAGTCHWQQDKTDTTSKKIKGKVTDADGRPWLKPILPIRPAAKPYKPTAPVISTLPLMPVMNWLCNWKPITLPVIP